MKEREIRKKTEAIYLEKLKYYLLFLWVLANNFFTWEN